MSFADLMSGLGSLAAPITCLGCREPLPAATPGWPGALCTGCQERLDWIEVACRGCGRARGGELGPAERCQSCAGRARGRVVGTCALWRYRGVSRTLVRRLKYGDLPELGAPLGAALAARVEGSARAEGLGLPAPETLVVPIPLHPLRRLQRGYNQADELAQGLAASLGLERADLLRRVRWTRPLYRIETRARARALRGAFRLTHGASLGGRPVLLVDDVRTSGATLRAAARVLHQGGAGEIRAAVLAR